ncbi:MAG: hypothetical protein Q7K65_01565 [Candidatus Buchananbacteria bacterium]|nr:hypothetical protein [Candidatus Buchananbacteria bacterium]
MNTPTEKKPSQKIIAVFVVAFAFFSWLILFLGTYYSQINGQVAGASDVSDPVKLAQDYRSAFNEVFKNYLILNTDTDWFSQDILAKTVSIKNNLLSLKVPAEFKDRHLQAVLALSEIEQGIKDKNIDLILPNIYELRQIIDNF